MSFGADHPGKDLDTVVRAFAAADAPATLVLAGEGASRAVARNAIGVGASGSERIVVLDGPQEERVRALVYSAADVAVLSFAAGRRADSGTLTDALAYELPIVCSDGCSVGADVDAHRAWSISKSWA